MSEQKNAVVPERRLGVYTYEEAEALLGIPAEELRRLVEQIERKPRRYLDAILLEKVWVTANPFIVTLKRNDGKNVTRSNVGIIQDAILAAGGILAKDMAQWRFPSLDEAERAASLQAPIPEHTWYAVELGFEKTMEHLKTVWGDLVQRA